jgi:PHD/YefM family antitoxin component YafN of YafNO toxin-antitoxin module
MKTFLIEKNMQAKVGKKSVVVIPLALWRKLEEYLEDQEALSSKKFLKRIREARKEVAGKRLIYPFKTARK